MKRGDVVLVPFPSLLLRSPDRPKMTDQQSLDEIKNLFLAYPGITWAGVFPDRNRSKVHIRFRCTNVESLKAIAGASVWANVGITLGNPKTRICAEPQDTRDLACDITIPDSETRTPTQPERVGVFLSDDLERRGLISAERLKHLHSMWNTRLANRRYNA